jgi:MFS family permease
MLRRFSLYGFLKNQRYFEPFLLLAFLEKGLSFSQIGLLVAVRELFVNLFEIPSGALADLYGRRRCMLLSFASYIVSFLLFGLADGFWPLAVAMLFFGGGEAFRTGTHKAMIFSWLRQQGRTAERTKVYGYTRSWSKIGSAVSVAVAALMVLASARYEVIFYVTVVPYLLGMVNFLGYPPSLDGMPPTRPSPKAVLRHLWHALHMAISNRKLGRLVLESMGFEGLFKSSKDYLQPILQAAAVALTAAALPLESLNEAQRASLLVGPVYMALHFLSAAASRNSHRLVGDGGDEERAARRLWTALLVLFALLLPALYFELYPLMILGFVAFHFLQDLWRPVLVSRFDSHGEEALGATLLSVENQAKSLGTMALAPLLGYAIDGVRLHGPGGLFWPIGVAGILVALSFRLTARTGTEPCQPSSD